jgi:hypothetical protein
MPHVREQIRNTFATLLSGLAGGRVYTSRVYPVDVLPAIGIFANSETSTQDPVLAASRLNRDVDVVVEIAAEAIADVDATVDGIASSVEAQIATNPTLSGIAVDVTLIGTTIEIDDAGDLPLAFARLTYRAWYRTTAGNPDSAI